MSQHDMNVANADGATVRADLNSALEALVTVNSGATAPATTFAHMYWVDTTSGTLKRRNAANTGWLIIATIDEARVVDRSSNTILDESDYGKTFRATSNFTQTLTAAATLADGWWCAYRIEENITITFDPASSENINGATTFAVSGPASGFVFCNGTAFYTVGFNRLSQIVFPATQVASSDPNTLDDYEEGTWTPVLTFATPGNLSVAYSTQVGTYQKVGNEVTVSLTLITSTFTHTTASGALQITGLPFTSVTLTGATWHGGAAWGGITKASYTDICGRVTSNVSIATFIASGSGVAAQVIAASDMPTAGSVVLQSTVHYRAAA